MVALAAYRRLTAFSACCREGRVMGTARPMLEDSVAPVMYPVMPSKHRELYQPHVSSLQAAALVLQGTATMYDASIAQWCCQHLLHATK